MWHTYPIRRSYWSIFKTWLWFARQMAVPRNLLNFDLNFWTETVQSSSGRTMIAAKKKFALQLRIVTLSTWLFRLILNLILTWKDCCPSMQPVVTVHLIIQRKAQEAMTPTTFSDYSKTYKDAILSVVCDRLEVFLALHQLLQRWEGL